MTIIERCKNKIADHEEFTRITDALKKQGVEVKEIAAACQMSHQSRVNHIYAGSPPTPLQLKLLIKFAKKRGVDL